MNFKSAISGVGSQLKVAGQYAAKQAEKTKLQNVTLPSAFRALGKDVYKTGLLRPEQPDLFGKLDACIGQIKAIKDEAGARPKADGLAQKAKAAAVATKEMGQTKAHEVQAAQLLGKLGEAVYAQHGQDSGPPELLAPIADASRRVQALDAEIAQLSQASQGKAITPKRIAIGGLATVVLLGVVLFLSIGGGNKDRLGDQLGANSGAHRSDEDSTGEADEGEATGSATDRKGTINATSPEVMFQQSAGWLVGMYVRAKGKDVNTIRTNLKKYYGVYLKSFRESHYSTTGWTKGFFAQVGRNTYNSLSEFHQENVNSNMEARVRGLEGTFGAITEFTKMELPDSVLGMTEVYCSVVGQMDGCKAACIELGIKPPVTFR